MTERYQGEHSGATGKISESKALTALDNAKAQVMKMGVEYAKVLPAHMTEAKFTRTVLTALQKDPNLLHDLPGLFAGSLQCASDGLLPDGKDAAFVTYSTKNGIKVVYMIMVSGILKKIRNSGEISTIMTQIIRKNDAFRYWVDGDGEHLTHEPLLFGERGEMVGVYALAKTKHGDVYIEPMTLEEIDKVRSVSKAKFGPWNDWFEEMAKKTAIRRLSKRLPMSTDLEDAIRRDDDLHEFSKDVTPKPNSIQERLAQIPVQTSGVQETQTVMVPVEIEPIIDEVNKETIITFGRLSGMAVGSIPKEELVTVYNQLKSTDKTAEPSEERTETIEILRSYLGFMK